MLNMVIYVFNKLYEYSDLPSMLRIFPYFFFNQVILSLISKSSFRNVYCMIKAGPNWLHCECSLSASIVVSGKCGNLKCDLLLNQSDCRLLLNQSDWSLIIEDISGIIN
jgi:hypothetical protein